MNFFSKWFIENPIAAKMFMLVLLLGGVLAYKSISKQFFPGQNIDYISVSMVYPGASPLEVESQIVRRIEEAVDQLSGIEEITSTAREGIANVTIEVDRNESSIRLLNDVKASVDSITTFPGAAEPPQIVEQRYKNEIISLLLSGAVSEYELKEMAEVIPEKVRLFARMFDWAACAG